MTRIAKKSSLSSQFHSKYSTVNCSKKDYEIMEIEKRSKIRGCSSPSTSPRPKSDSENEIVEKSKIMARSDMFLQSISLEEDQDLPNPPPSKKARTKFDKFKLKTDEYFLPPGGGFLNNEKILKVYQSQIAEMRTKNKELMAKNEELKTKNEAINDDVDVQIVGFKIKSNADLKVNQSEDSQVKSVDFMARSELLKVLECSSCKKLPKQQQNIYGCSQGILLCQNCVDNAEKCSVCLKKDKVFEEPKDKAFREPIINEIFPNVQKSHMQCRFELCKAELNITDLKDHESFCTHREVPCPSTHRGACMWNGPLSQLMRHMRENGCVQVVLDDSCSNSTNQSISANQTITTAFKSNICDFPATEKSVFKRNGVITHWKPVLLLSKNFLNIWCHVLIQRDSLGLWRLMAYSMLPKDCTNQINIKITVGDSVTGRTFNFSGKLTSFETSAEQATKEGNFLHLHDIQIKPFKIIGKPILFDYNIELKVEAELISKINLRSQKIPMDSEASAEKKTGEKNILPKLPKLMPQYINRLNGL